MARRSAAIFRELDEGGQLDRAVLGDLLDLEAHRRQPPQLDVLVRRRPRRDLGHQLPGACVAVNRNANDTCAFCWPVGFASLSARTAITTHWRTSGDWTSSRRTTTSLN